VRYDAPGCYAGSPCGYIALDRKSSDPAGGATQVYDNIAMVAIGGGSTTSRNDHNQDGTDMKDQRPTTQWSGYKLASDSAGRNAASAGHAVGARIG
jgi:hypothetical protein